MISRRKVYIEVLGLGVGAGLGNNLRDWTSCVVECTLKVLVWLGAGIHSNNLDTRV